MTKALKNLYNGLQPIPLHPFPPQIKDFKCLHLKDRHFFQYKESNHYTKATTCLAPFLKPNYIFLLRIALTNSCTGSEWRQTKVAQWLFLLWTHVGGVEKESLTSNSTRSRSYAWKNLIMRDYFLPVLNLQLKF